MNRYISTTILALLTTTAVAKDAWDVGLAAGMGMASASETLNYSYLGRDQRYKFNLKGNGPVAGITTGYTIEREQNTFGLQVGAYKDFFTAKNNDLKKDTLSSSTIDTNHDVKRTYTLELAGKVGRFLTPDTHVYGKAGVLKSQFQEQISDPLVNAKRKFAAWGGVLGLGVQKSFESIRVGMEYNYHCYGRVGTTIEYATGGVSFANRSKFRPQYHNVLLTISKSF